MENNMEKVLNIIKTAKLNMKELLLTINMMGMENIYGKMVNII